MLQLILINTKTASGVGISFSDAGYSERLQENTAMKKIKKKIKKVEREPSSGSYVTYKMSNSLVALRDSSYLPALLNYFYR